MSATEVVTNAVVSSVEARSQAVQAFTMHHVADGHVWMVFPKLIEVRLPGLLTVHGLMVVMAAALLVVLLSVLCRKMPAVPTGFLNVVETFVKFIRDDIAIPFFGEADGLRMTPVLCSFFFFILTMNLIGLIPCFAAATGDLSVTGALAVVTLLFMTVGAVIRLGVIGFFKGFVPHVIPWPILIILVPVEIIGVFIKAFALMIRLFANMLAGHIVIFSLVGLVLMFGYVALPAVAMALGVYLLEVLVAFLQAYIFTLLSALFIGERLHPSH